MMHNTIKNTDFDLLKQLVIHEANCLNMEKRKKTQLCVEVSIEERNQKISRKSCRENFDTSIENPQTKIPNDAPDITEKYVSGLNYQLQIPI